MLMTAVITAIGAYLLGSINFAVIFTKLFIKQDVRELGSGNAGTTNAMRVAGPLPGILTFVCDALKGFVACGMGYLIFKYMVSLGFDWAQPIYGAYICGVACMAGHMFPIFFQFKGGKGVAVSVGIFLVCSWPAILIGLAVFAAVLLITRYVSLSSLIATVTVVILSVVFRDTTASLWPQLLLTLIMAAAIFWKHTSNIKRLLGGTESKISFGGKRK